MSVAAAYDDAFVRWLLRQGYSRAKVLGPGRYAAIRPLSFDAWELVTGRTSDRDGSIDGWTYASREAVEQAFDAWTGQGEPSGWRRHTRSGRRRPEGNPALEYVST